MQGVSVWAPRSSASARPFFGRFLTKCMGQSGFWAYKVTLCGFTGTPDWASILSSEFTSLSWSSDVGHSIGVWSAACSDCIDLPFGSVATTRGTVEGALAV